MKKGLRLDKLLLFFRAYRYVRNLDLMKKGLRLISHVAISIPIFICEELRPYEEGIGKKVKGEK
jgi:hypothetical protein